MVSFECISASQNRKRRCLREKDMKKIKRINFILNQLFNPCQNQFICCLNQEIKVFGIVVFEKSNYPTWTRRGEDARLLLPQKTLVSMEKPCSRKSY